MHFLEEEEKEVVILEEFATHRFMGPHDRWKMYRKIPIMVNNADLKGNLGTKSSTRDEHGETMSLSDATDAELAVNEN